MPLIPKRETIEYAPISVRLRAHTLSRVDLYAKFVNDERASVIDALLQYAMAKDKEFATWLQAMPTTPEPAKAARNGAS